MAVDLPDPTPWIEWVGVMGSSSVTGGARRLISHVVSKDAVAWNDHIVSFKHV